MAVVSKKTKGLALVTVAVTTIALVVRQQSRFGEGQFRQLAEGMSEAEVVAVLGCPAGDYRPAIWREPDWFVSNRDPVGFLLMQRGQTLDQLQALEGGERGR